MLLADGHRVLGIDNLVRGTLSNIHDALQHPNFSFSRIDSQDEGAVVAAIQATGGYPDMIWHLAANSDIAAGGEDPDIDYRDTFLTTYVTAKIARRFGVRKFAFASTSAVYGDHGPIALREDIGPLFPISNYGAMKLSSEAVLTALSEGHLDRLWIFRFPNVIGARATHGVIYDFLDKLEATPDRLVVLGNGTQMKPYLYVDDLLEAMQFIVGKAADRINCFNIGPEDAGVSVREIAETVVTQTSPSATIQYGSENRGWVGDVPKFHYAVDKLKKLGWAPTYSSRHAVVRAVTVQLAERAGLKAT